MYLLQYYYMSFWQRVVTMQKNLTFILGYIGQFFVFLNVLYSFFLVICFTFGCIAQIIKVGVEQQKYDNNFGFVYIIVSSRVGKQQENIYQCVYFTLLELFYQKKIKLEGMKIESFWNMLEYFGQISVKGTFGKTQKLKLYKQNRDCQVFINIIQEQVGSKNCLLYKSVSLEKYYFDFRRELQLQFEERKRVQLIVQQWYFFTIFFPLVPRIYQIYVHNLQQVFVFQNTSRLHVGFIVAEICLMLCMALIRQQKHFTDKVTNRVLILLNYVIYLCSLSLLKFMTNENKSELHVPYMPTIWQQFDIIFTINYFTLTFGNLQMYYTQQFVLHSKKYIQLPTVKFPSCTIHMQYFVLLMLVSSLFIIVSIMDIIMQVCLCSQIVLQVFSWMCVQVVVCKNQELHQQKKKFAN
eukprot:TRINITY_DN1038_c1_g1_i8.p3 TRINITY_DN1038_c1_g1~~TRINITY_DN1038_c1_g1_i8.p3  ORF type:complete len:409 (+),score=-4.26 TRINITY_DN1038_c1_g1_i8:275-1501(+)